MFAAQLIGTFSGATMSFLVTWWMFTSIKNICHPELLLVGSPWTCPDVNMDSSINTMYGLIGPSRVFYPHGIYSSVFLFFWVGAIAPVPLWLLSKAYPQKLWLRKINFPIIFTAGAYIPPTTAMHYWMWFFIGIFFSHYVYKNHKVWWAKYVYILSIGLDTGVTVMVLVASVTVNMADIYGVKWWGLALDDHCLLSSCPMAPGCY
ncbi:hypothetical protein LUZ60_007391 [Juncus effusus]|nr:hypothetical protein LUZ60_007391 [Juncus effusus]